MKKIILYSAITIGSFVIYSCGSSAKISEQKDGLSFETAIKAKSVEDEYLFIRQNCNDCKVKSQALSENKGKPFDVITVEKSDGTTLKYYFDIKSFYGKFY
ncbi:hypothetical protein [Chryseobacterium sp. JUb7]|uniref:hypothetical protein n=1 Tax=Chryseobacterium sp. JUb7 TaxID=2940599 RepID=UPI00216A062F|nr:hypothetical protein [Chryseobacterium sp. JUb7]MCS3532606.1 hypothetical protein [Chryseobacterium sp. JUb7]